jgi:gamma-aminobutyric acid receptor subunit alpha
MTFLGLEARTDLPKVAYPTALDFFVFLSFAFIFATILQFAVVHYFTKYGSGECYFNFDSSSESEGEEDDAAATYFPQTSAMSTSHLSSLSRLSQIDATDMYGVIPLSRLELDVSEDTCSSRVVDSCRRFIGKYFFCLAIFSKDMRCRDGGGGSDDASINESMNESEQQRVTSAASTATENTPRVQRRQPKNTYRQTFNSVSKIDKLSRVIFPLLFFIINLIYWAFYLSRSQRK